MKSWERKPATYQTTEGFDLYLNPYKGKGATSEYTADLMQEYIKLRYNHYEPLMAYSISLEQKIAALEQENRFLTQQLSDLTTSVRKYLDD